MFLLINSLIAGHNVCLFYECRGGSTSVGGPIMDSKDLGQDSFQNGRGIMQAALPTPALKSPLFVIIIGCSHLVA